MDPNGNCVLIYIVESNNKKQLKLIQGIGVTTKNSRTSNNHGEIVNKLHVFLGQFDGFSNFWQKDDQSAFRKNHSGCMYVYIYINIGGVKQTQIEANPSIYTQIGSHAS